MKVVRLTTLKATAKNIGNDEGCSEKA